MRKTFTWALLVAMVGSRSMAAEPSAIEYTIILDEPQTQLVTIQMRMQDLDGEQLDLMLPVWRPGRYLILDLASGMRHIEARDVGGRELAVAKSNKTTWQVDLAGADEVVVEYDIYANDIAMRTRHVDDTHAFLSGESVFLYTPDRRAHPIHITVQSPPDWSVATGLAAHPTRPRTYVSPDYDVLVDSPFEIGLHDTLRFSVNQIPHEIVIWPPDAARYDAEKLKSDFATIVREQFGIFGELPYDRYVFMLHVGAPAGGGTEHLNSTIMQTSRQTLEKPDRYRRFLGLVSHEMFHTWNVKQLRPAGLIPYDYQRENYTTLLWVAEGTTSYYDDLTLVRSGLISVDQYLEIIGKNIDSQRRRPGGRVQSLEASSFDAWVRYYHPNPDDPNTTVSYYSKGALVSLLLDLAIRDRSGGVGNLDEVMASMYQRFPLDGGGYTKADMLQVIAEVSGSSFEAFIDQYVASTTPPPTEELLGTVGLELFRKPDAVDGDDAEDENADSIPMGAYLGLNLEDEGHRTRVKTVYADGPAYKAGVLPGDQVLALNQRRLPASEYADRLRTLDPGESVTLHFYRNDVIRTLTFNVGQQPKAKWTVRHMEQPTDQQRTAYEAWIGHAWPGDLIRD